MNSQTSSILSFTRLSRALAVLLLCGFFAQLIAPSLRQYIALVPGRTLPCVWNVFTAGFIEVNYVKLAVSIVGLLWVAKTLEPIWGSKEFLKFVALVNTACGAGTFVLIYLLYLADRSGQLLYLEVCGFHGVLAGMLVAIKQIMPDSDVTLLVVLKFRAKHLPAVFLLLTTLASIFFKSPLEEVPFVVFGTYFSWFYLRFLQQRPENNLKGDPSDEFRFATFFPEFLQPPVDMVAGVFAKMCGLGGTSGNASLPTTASGPLPGSDTAESTRRRERGARALEERLGKAVKTAAKADSDDKGDVESGGVGVTQQ